MPHLKMYGALLSVSLSLCSLMIVGGATYWLWPSPSTPPPSAPPSVPVTTVEVGRRDVPVLIHAIGNVRSLRSVDMRSQVDGLLLELPVSEGQFVNKGDLLARMDDRGIAAALEHAKAQRAVTRAQLVSATLDLKRYRDLASINAVSAQILDQQIALVAQLQATIKSQDATVSASQVQLTHTRIHSPMDGRLGIRNVHEGSYVRAGDAQALFSVVQLDPISIESSLPQARLPQLQALMTGAQTASAVLRAHSANDGALLGEGRLELIDNRVSAETGTVRIKGTVANPNGNLWPDQSIVIKLQADTLQDALVVPQHSLRQGAEGTFVWRIRDSKAFPQPVRVEYADIEIAVVDGLEAGDRIVTDGYSRLTPGAAVKVLPSQDVAKQAVADRSPLR